MALLGFEPMASDTKSKNSATELQRLYISILSSSVIFYKDLNFRILDSMNDFILITIFEFSKKSCIFHIIWDFSNKKFLWSKLPGRRVRINNRAQMPWFRPSNSTPKFSSKTGEPVKRPVSYLALSYLAIL